MEQTPQASVLRAEGDIVEHVSRLLTRLPGGIAPLLGEPETTQLETAPFDVEPQPPSFKEETFQDDVEDETYQDDIEEPVTPQPKRSHSATNETRPVRAKAPTTGKVKIKVFHPDVDQGGGFVVQEVDANNVPPGAIIVSGTPAPSKQERPPRQPRGNVLAGAPPAGGILAAGKRLREQGISVKPSETTPSSSPTADTEKVSVTATAPAAITEQSATAEKKPPAGLGASFMQGLPGASSRPNQARSALESAFSGLTSRKPKPKPAATPVAKQHVVIDGRLIEAPGQQAEEKMQLGGFRELQSPSLELGIFECQITKNKKNKLDVHLLLWPEGEFKLLNRVNDSDPRPRIWAEEGVRGLGMTEREKELQRWSLREWWDGLKEKGYAPVASFAANRAIRDFLQVAFMYEPDYDVYRMFQASELTLEGTYPMLLLRDGALTFAELALDGVGEKERITPQRMQELLGDHAKDGPIDAAFTVIPALQNSKPVDLSAEASLNLFRDQLEHMFRFPALKLPDPLGGTGMITVQLGLWEMSQPGAHALRADAIAQKPITLQASAGNISDLVRRELWRMKSQPAKQWGGYTPKQIMDAIRAALLEDHYNMQGFQPKKPGDYRYDEQKGLFEIVLRRYPMTHSMLLRGTHRGENVLGALVMYGKKGKEGFDPFEDYAYLLKELPWSKEIPGLEWTDAWLTAPAHEGRATWADIDGLPSTPVLRRMPDWHRGIAQALFLVEDTSEGE